MKHLKDIFESKIKQTTEFIMIKPGFIDLTPQLFAKMKSVGLIPVRWEQKILTIDEAKKFYHPHRNEDFYDDLCRYMISGTSMGIECINTRGIDVGKFKDKIRKEYGKDDMKNVIHSSDSPNRKVIEKNIYLKK